MLYRMRGLEDKHSRFLYITGVDRKQYEDVLGISGNQLLFYSTSPSDRSVHVRRVSLPSNLFPLKKAESTIPQP